MSYADSLLKLDGRTQTGRIGKLFRTELVSELGGAPTEMQKLLVDEAVKLRLQLLGHHPADALDRLLQVRHLLGIEDRA